MHSNIEQNESVTDVLHKEYTAAANSQLQSLVLHFYTLKYIQFIHQKKYVPAVYLCRQTGTQT